MTFLSTELQVKSKRHNRKGILWIYGDSVSKSFAENLVTGPYHETCGKTFKECKVTYSWVYNVKSLKSEEKLDGRDYDEEKVMAEINKVNGFIMPPVSSGIWSIIKYSITAVGKPGAVLL